MNLSRKKTKTLLLHGGEGSETFYRALFKIVFIPLCLALKRFLGPIEIPP